MASFFLLWSSFFRTTSTVASSEAPADYQPAPGRTDGVPERHQRQWIINPSLQIVPGTSTEQVVDKGIRQKSTKDWTHSLTAVPFVRGHRSVFPGLRETPACIHVIQRLSQPRVACWHGFRQNSQKTECVFTRCPTGGRKKIACIYGLRSEGVNTDVKWLKTIYYNR